MTLVQKTQTSNHFLNLHQKNILVHNMCLKWEMAMMTSRLRATVMKEMEESRTYISITAVWGCAGFLQEEFRCGTQSSDSSRAAIVRRACWNSSGTNISPTAVLSRADDPSSLTLTVCIISDVIKCGFIFQTLHRICSTFMWQFLFFRLRPVV